MPTPAKVIVSQPEDWEESQSTETYSNVPVPTPSAVPRAQTSAENTEECQITDSTNAQEPTPTDVPPGPSH